MTTKTVTVRQFLDAQIEVSKDWAADDPRWGALNTMLDYSLQYGQWQRLREQFERDIFEGDK
jgi:hypothetical protein